MVLICLEYTVATAFEIELNLFSLEEVMEHEHGVAAVRFVALGLVATARESAPPTTCVRLAPKAWCYDVSGTSSAEDGAEVREETGGSICPTVRG